MRIFIQYKCNNIQGISTAQFQFMSIDYLDFARFAN